MLYYSPSLVRHEDGVIPLGAIFVIVRLPVTDLIQHVVSIFTGIFGVIKLVALEHNLCHMEPDLVSECWVDVPRQGNQTMRSFHPLLNNLLKLYDYLTVNLTGHSVCPSLFKLLLLSQSLTQYVHSLLYSSIYETNPPLCLNSFLNICCACCIFCLSTNLSICCSCLYVTYIPFFQLVRLPALLTTSASN